VMALYMAHKRLSDGGGSLSVSRTNLETGKRTEQDAERDDDVRDKRRALGESGLFNTGGRQSGHYR